MPFRRILVGLDLELRELEPSTDRSSVDLPPATRHLFDQAVSWAVAQRAELRLVGVLDGPDLTRTPATAPQVTAFVQLMNERLEALADQAKEFGIDCSVDLIGGDPATELQQQSEDWAADLLLIGAGRHSSRLGQTALKLLRTATCSVFVDRYQEKKKTEAENDDGDSSVTAVIHDDLSDPFQSKLLQFVGCGLWRDAKCWLIHVAELPRWTEAWQAGTSPDQLAQWKLARVASIRSQLHQRLSYTDHRTMTFGILPDVVEGDVADTLLKLLNERKIDLLICDEALTDSVLPFVSCSVLKL